MNLLAQRRYREFAARIKIRDGGICWLCGLPGADSVDHVVPRVRGGALMDPANCRAAHRSCNAAKGDRPPQVPTTSRIW